MLQDESGYLVTLDLECSPGQERGVGALRTVRNLARRQNHHLPTPRIPRQWLV